MADVFTPELIFGLNQYGTLTPDPPVPAYKTIRIGGLGPEINGDPSFDNAGYWVAGSGWAVSGGEAVGTAANGWLGHAATPPSAGLTYRITFTVTNYSAGTVRAYVGTASAYTPGVTANGLYTYDVLATSDGEFGLNSPDGFTGSVTDLSIKQVL